MSAAMRMIIEDDGSPPVHTIGNRERENIATEAMQWALPKGLTAAGVCIIIALLSMTFNPEPHDLPLWLVVIFYLIAWPLGLFIWKRAALRRESQKIIDALNSIERDEWLNNNKTRSTGSAEDSR